MKFSLLTLLLGKALATDVFQDGWYDTIPTFMHTCRFYGGITEQDMETYEFDKYQMLTVEKGEYLYDDLPDAGGGVYRNYMHTEWKMIDTCKRFKQKYGMNRTCFLYFNELLNWEWYKLAEDYEDLLASHPRTDIIPWDRNGDATFPNSKDIRVPDLRKYAQYDVITWWLDHINATVNAAENATYVDGIFIDRGYVAHKGGSPREAGGIWTLHGSGMTQNVVTDNTFGTICDEGLAHGLNCFEDYTLGKLEALNRIETEYNIKTVVNPGSYYYSDFASDAQFLNNNNPIAQIDVFDLKFYFQDSSMLHFENFCPNGHDAYRLQRAILAGKEVQVHGGYTDDCGGNGFYCKDIMRRYLAAYLLGVEGNAKTYFICNRYWSLNQDEGDYRDAVGSLNELMRFAEYDLPLGVPGPRVLQIDTTQEVPLTDNFNRDVYRPFYDRENGLLNAVVVWNGNTASSNTVCFVHDCVKKSAAPNRCIGNSNICPSVLSLFETTLAPTTSGSPTAAPTTTPPTSLAPTNSPSVQVEDPPSSLPSRSPVEPESEPDVAITDFILMCVAGSLLVVIVEPYIPFG